MFRVCAVRRNALSLRAIGAAALVTHSQITSDAQEDLLRNGLKQFEMIHLPTGFHMVQLLHPATCANHVLRFCAAQDGITTTDA